MVYSHLEGEQRTLYAAKALELKKELESGGCADGGGKLQILSGLMRLRQICCDPRLCLKDYRAGSAKLETCVDLIRRGVEGEHKILVFSQFASMLELIGERLEKRRSPVISLRGRCPRKSAFGWYPCFQRIQSPCFSSV